MSDLIIIFRMNKESLGVISDDSGAPAVFGSTEEAERLCEEHPFVKHVDHEILEINI